MYWTTTHRSKLDSDPLLMFTGLEEPQPIKVYLRLKDDTADFDKIKYSIDDSKIIHIQSSHVARYLSRDRPEENSDEVKRTFKFDEVFNIDASQTDVQHSIVPDTIHNLFQGYNLSIITYGQKCSGKTYSLYGENNEEGLAGALMKQIFNEIDNEKNDREVEYTVKLSFLEVYLEKLYDLLDSKTTKKSLKIQNAPSYRGLPVENLCCVYCDSYDKAIFYINEGIANLNARHTGIIPRTNTIFDIFIEKRNRHDNSITCSTLYLVDLAGSDLVGRDKSAGIHSEDAKKLNSSIMSIQDVVGNLSKVDREEYNTFNFSLEVKIPYGATKLAKLLQDPLGGNCKTSILLSCSLDKEQENGTLSTLRFGCDAKKSRTSAHINKTGLNSKSTFEIILSNMKLKEENYKSSISLLHNEIESLNTKILSLENNPLLDEAKQRREDNDKLKAQLSTLAELINNPEKRSTMKQNNPLNLPNKKKKNENNEEVLSVLMEKCEHIASLELHLDDKMRENLVLKMKRADDTTKLKTVESMNEHLLDRIRSLELQLKDLLSSNGSLKTEMESGSHWTSSGLGKVNNPDSDEKGDTGSRYHLRKTSVTSSVGSSMLQINEENSQKSWIFGSKNKISWNANRSVSAGSMTSVTSLETLQQKPSMKGLDLHVLKFGQKKKNTPSN